MRPGVAAPTVVKARRVPSGATVLVEAVVAPPWSTVVLVPLQPASNSAVASATPKALPEESTDSAMVNSDR